MTPHHPNPQENTAMTTTTATGVHVETVDVTPDMAKQWLDTRPDTYRHARRGKVSGFARDMRLGRWRSDNGQTIAISPDGHLVDGQHRLQAVIDSGCPHITLLVAYNVPEDTTQTIDTGTARSLADELKYQGLPNSVIMAAVLRRAYLWNQGIKSPTGGTIAVTHADALQLLDGNSLIVEAAQFGADNYKDAGIPPAVLGFGYYLFTFLDYNQGREFCERICDGIGLAAGHPVLAFRQRIIRLRTERIDDAAVRITAEGILALLIMAWNAHREGRPLLKVQLPKGKLTQANFPEPK